ncbi:MAG: hypothetical protein PVI59_11715 [Anaerolineae bacterium]|jgi:hypothetical protein
MQGPFEVGEQYRNRDGEYEVVEIDTPHMTIEYSDGRVIETTVALQARIWRNILMDKRAKREARERAKRAKRRRRRRQRRGRKFEGLDAEDFKTDITGTSWRRREDLGGRLAQRMTDTTPHFFQSHAMYRKPEVHIAQPEYYERKKKEQKAKYFFRLNEQVAMFGLYIEKNDGPMDETWHWVSLIDSLPEKQAVIDEAMREHDLHWEAYSDGEKLIAEVEVGEEQLVWKGSNGVDEIDWAEFAERLDDIDADTWCNLYLVGEMEKSDALSAGTELGDRIARVYRDLLPLYVASTQDES